MHRRVALLIGVLIMPMLCACATNSTRLTPDDDRLAALAWLAGEWVSCDDSDDVRTEEHWTHPAGGSMLGVNRTLAGTESGDPHEWRTVFFEFLRLEHTDDGQTIYHAAPRGRHPATPFKLIESDDNRFVFSSPDHDYPQRIIYACDDDGNLRLCIEGVENGVDKSSEWTLRRVK